MYILINNLNILLTSLLSLLFSNALTLKQEMSMLYSRSTLLILTICFIISMKTKTKNNVGLFGGLFHLTNINHTFQIFILSISVIILKLTAFLPRKIHITKYSSIIKILFYKIISLNTNIFNKMLEQFRIIEYSLILLFVITGAVFLTSSSDIVSIFLSIELQSYGLYLLSTIYRNSELATSAGLTYFLLGGLSSSIILLGSSLLYGNSGSTNLDGYYIIISISDIANNLVNQMLLWYKANYINISLLIMSIGFLFKISAAPFHFWSPDVYDAIPTIVTTFVAILAKISIFILLLELVHYTSNSNFSIDFNWTTSLLVSSLLSLIIGTILGLNQSRIKRLLAYSTISHIGYILLGLSINSIESTQSFIFYLMQYSITNLNVFIILILIGYSLYFYTYTSDSTRITSNEEKKFKDLVDKNNSPIQLTNQLKGYYNINPFLAVSLAITIFSFMGIPPMIGFFGKLMILSAALDKGYLFLVLIAILTSVISAVYYLNIIKKVFFDESIYDLNQECSNLKINVNVFYKNNLKEEITLNVKNIFLSNILPIIISTLTLAILIFIFNQNEWLSLTKILALILYNNNE